MWVEVFHLCFKVSWILQESHSRVTVRKILRSLFIMLVQVRVSKLLSYQIIEVVPPICHTCATSGRYVRRPILRKHPIWSVLKISCAIHHFSSKLDPVLYDDVSSSCSQFCTTWNNSHLSRIPYLFHVQTAESSTNRRGMDCSLFIQFETFYL